MELYFGSNVPRTRLEAEYGNNSKSIQNAGNNKENNDREEKYNMIFRLFDRNNLIFGYFFIRVTFKLYGQNLMFVSLESNYFILFYLCFRIHFFHWYVEKSLWKNYYLLASSRSVHKIIVIIYLKFLRSWLMCSCLLASQQFTLSCTESCEVVQMDDVVWCWWSWEYM